VFTKAVIPIDDADLAEITKPLSPEILSELNERTAAAARISVPPKDAAPRR
jgi:hypothetical protein